VRAIRGELLRLQLGQLHAHPYIKDAAALPHVPKASSTPQRSCGSVV
jgi:hypothetical protein